MFSNLQERDKFLQDVESGNVVQAGTWFRLATYKNAEYTDDQHLRDCASLAASEIYHINGRLHSHDRMLLCSAFHLMHGFCSIHKGETLSTFLGGLYVCLTQRDPKQFLSQKNIPLESDEAFVALARELDLYLHKTLTPNETPNEIVQEGVKVAMAHGLMSITPQAVNEMWNVMKAKEKELL